MNKHVFTLLFLLGAAVLLWVGAGFMGSHLLALTVTLLIAAVYGYGTLELARFRQASASLRQALLTIPEGLCELPTWLARVHPTLQNPVRLRIEGERIAMPGPALTPYLVGLLVMLGMLGTFLGMVVTLNGAVFALEGTPDLQAIRNAFATPIRGLGLAFGTSVAGVATSALLGLMSALSRRERATCSQLLDSRIATQLRGFSLTHQRQEAFKALQLQSQALPLVVDKLHGVMEQMQRMGQQMNEQLLGNQARFHNEVSTAYTALAASVDRSLRESLAHSALAASESLQPVLQAAMSGMAAESRQLHERVVAATQSQTEHLVQTTQTQIAQLVKSTQGQTDALSTQFQASASSVAASWTSALGQHTHSSAQLLSGLDNSLQAFNASFETRAQALLQSVQQAYAGLQSEHKAGDQQRLQAWMASLEAMAAGLQAEWQSAGAQSLAQQQALCKTLSHTAQQVTDSAHQSADKTLGAIQTLLASAEELQHARQTRDAEWTQAQALRSEQMASLLRTELSALREAEAERGQAAVERLGALQTALTSHLGTLGTALEAPITRLIHTASEAPRAAAEVIGQLRQQVSKSVERDNELLEERGRILQTLNTLLDGIHHASTEQRAVIDALVSSSALALEQAGAKFAERVTDEASKLSDIAASVTSSAVDVSSLSEAFGFAVQSFNAANEKLIANLQRIEGAMDKSMARSDEQLAYYVAQAREVIDLSISSQKDVVQELRQLAHKQALLAEEAA